MVHMANTSLQTYSTNMLFLFWKNRTRQYTLFYCYHQFSAGFTKVNQHKPLLKSCSNLLSLLQSDSSSAQNFAIVYSLDQEDVKNIMVSNSSLLPSSHVPFLNPLATWQSFLLHFHLSCVSLKFNKVLWLVSQ